MPLLSLLAALAAAQLQISFGQQISDGVAPHKRTTPQQSQNATVAASVVESEQKLIIAKNWDRNNLNNSATFPNGATITNIKFLRNPAYEGPMPSFSMINKNAPVPSSGASRDAMPVNLQSTLVKTVAPNAAGQMDLKQTEDGAESISTAPVLISFTPRFAGIMPSQTPYCISGSPTQSASPSMAALQSSFSPQQSYQALSSVQCQPTNIQNPSNMRLRFVPASPSGSMQSTLPIQSTVPMYNTMPVQNTIPIQNTLPIQNTMPMQKIVDNSFQNPHLSLLLSHMLSQCPVRQEYLTPSIMRYPYHQDQKPSKLTVVKTLLPLLLELLAEKDSDCCEGKKERPRTNTKYKQGSKQLSKCDVNFLEHGALSRTADHRRRVSQNKVLKPYDDSREDEDYSDESSDYSAEDYDDESNTTVNTTNFR